MELHVGTSGYSYKEWKGPFYLLGISAAAAAPTYDDGDLERWAQSVAARGWHRAFVFFKHEDAGSGPEMAARFTELAG